MTFPTDYDSGRANFLAAAATAGAGLHSHRHPLPGPNGRPLFLDVARLGPPDARRVLFVASGTHGVEGLCGSGLQTALLADGVFDRLPDGVAVVLLHALNPWGFAWLRRVNEDNVDINRNFLDHSAPHPENADYDGLDAVLNPSVLEEADVGAVLGAVEAFQRERGAEAAYRALSGGQYRHPRGVQYGGVAPVWSNRVLRAIWAAHAERAELGVFVDLHSGLGPRGVGLVLQTAAGDSTAARLAQQWWPDVVRAEPGQGADAALVSGLIGPAFVAALSPAAAVGVVLEFGTEPMPQVILAVQADNWLHHHGTRDSERGRAIARAMRDAFFLDDPEWQSAVRERARGAIGDALAGMAAFTRDAGNGPRLRAAAPTDCDVLVEFARAMAAETEDKALDVATLRAGTESLLADPERGRVYVIEDAGTVVASLMLTIEWSEWRNGFFWWIQSVYVHPDHRRRGFYRRLHEHVRARALANPDVCGIRLYVERENHAAQETYRAIGMLETDYLLFEESTR